MEIKQVYILGNHIQALGLSRMAAKMNLRVTLFNDYWASVTRFSSSCHKFILFKDKAHLLELLTKGHPQKDILLVATNDNLIGFMAENYDFLSKHYSLSIPDPEIVQVCYNKRKTYLRAKELDIPIPESYFPNSMDEIKTLSKKIAYPVILKPAIMYSFHSSTGKKVYHCKNAQELTDSYSEMLRHIPAEEVIVQECLPGGAKNLFSFGSFFSRGEVYGGFIANRIRQKPMDFGISTCFAHTVLNPEIQGLAINFLKGIDYFGMSEVEFMFDEKSGSYKLIEINPRSWKWHSIANKLDIPLFEMMVHDIEGKPIEKKINTVENIGWVERLTDTYVVIGEILKGNLSISSYLKSMRLSKESAAWDFSDPLPSIMYLLLSPILLFKRN